MPLLVELMSYTVTQCCWYHELHRKSVACFAIKKVIRYAKRYPRLLNCHVAIPPKRAVALLSISKLLEVAVSWGYGKGVHVRHVVAVSRQQIRGYVSFARDVINFKPRLELT